MSFERFPVSLKFDMDSPVFVNTVGVLREQKTLSTVITHLLELYHDDAELRDKVNKRVANNGSVDFQSLIVQFERIAVEHQKTMLATGALKTHIDSNASMLYDIDVSSVKLSQEEIESRGNSLLSALGIPNKPKQIEQPAIDNALASAVFQQMNEMQNMINQLMQNQANVVKPQAQVIQHKAVDTSDSHVIPFKIDEPAVTVAKQPYVAPVTEDDSAPVVSYAYEPTVQSNLDDAPIIASSEDDASSVVKKPSSFGKLASSVGK